MRLSGSFASGIAATLVCASTAQADQFRTVVYFDQWHYSSLPPKSATAGVTHVIMAFANSNSLTSYSPFKSLSEVRSMFDDGTKVGIAVGGWGDNAGYDEVSKTDESRKEFAKNIASLVETNGFDFVDIDWEYPGGDGADYKTTPNSEKTYQIEAFPQMLADIKSAISPKPLSIAVPGLQRDMIAYTAEQGPKIWEQVDMVNVMSYDLMNRRDSATKHHTDVAGSLASVEAYQAIGLDPAKMNLGFAFYAKHFQTADGADCSSNPIGCPIVAAEDASGTDTGTSGAVTFESSPADTKSDVLTSWAAAKADGGKMDEQNGGQWWWDASAKIFWTWETTALMDRKFSEIVQAKGLGGVMAWSLGEDSEDWSHLTKLTQAAKGSINKRQQPFRIRGQARS